MGEEALKDELKVRKLTDKQRTAIKLEILFRINKRAGTPTHELELRELLKKARVGSSMLAEIDDWAEEQLGWNILREYDAIVSASKRAKLDATT